MASASEILVEFDFENGTPTPVNNGTATNTTPGILAAHFSVSGLTGFFYQDNASGGNLYNDSMGGRHANAIRTGAAVTDTSTFTTAGTSGEIINYESFSGDFWGLDDYTTDLSYSIDGGASVAAGTFDTVNQTAVQASGTAFDFTDFSTGKSVVWTLTFTAESNNNGRMRFDDLALTGSIIRGTVIAVQ